MRRFRDRQEAGRQLGQALQSYAPFCDGLVLALPRGGVPIGYEVASALGVELDILLVRKLGVPGQEELAMGAIASGGHQVLNPDVIQILSISPEDIALVAAAERQELDRREQLYRGDRPRPVVQGRDVIVVDDGLATGASMRAAVAALGAEAPRQVIAAVPTGSEDACQQLRAEADITVCLITPRPYLGVGRWYLNFSQVSDDEVRQLLGQAKTRVDHGHPMIYPPA